MNKALTALFIVLLLALWLTWPINSKVIQPSQPNTVSFSGDSPKDPKPSQPNTNKPKADSNSTLKDVVVSEPYLTKAPKELTYMDVYRMKRLYVQCQDVIYAVLENENYDAMTRFENNAAHFIKNQPTWPTKSQFLAVERHALKCEALLNQVQALDLPQLNNDNNRQSSYLDLREQLTEFLTAMKPDSSKASRIADVLSLIQVWNQHYQAVLDSSKGDETQNTVEIERIKAQIKQLRTQVDELSSQIQEPRSNPDLPKKLIKIRQEIRLLGHQITELKLINPETRNEALAVFEVVNNELFNRLRTQDPDVFFETQLALERNRSLRGNSFGHSPYKDIGTGQFKMPFIEYVSPGDVFKSMVGIGDNELFRLVINYATQLYHCELGADCGPNSRWVNYYCITATPFMNPVSCDLDLLTFYQQHLLNQNQWDDVQTVLNQIRGTYAE